MKTKTKIFLSLLLMATISTAQTNFSFTNPVFPQLLKGNFDPGSFPKRTVIADQQLANYLIETIQADSLKYYLSQLVAFKNRNTISDDQTRGSWGIRGARNYIKSNLDRWGLNNGLSGPVLVHSEFEFDFEMCDRLRHTQLMAMIPGVGPLKEELVILEAHLDSRCENNCDTTCIAEGADDNGSGSALLIELARVLSHIELNRSVLLIWITGEEQGLGGSTSFAEYCKQNTIKIKSVFNNDIVGGIECGITSSPPGCPGPYLYDSLRFRVFSAGITNSMPKALARLSRILVENKLAPIMPNVTKIDVMFGEDRSGRGSDHIPFREQGYTAIRFSSSYEHGDGNPSQAGYADRQHSTRDVLGEDIDGDGLIDSFFVNFNYLRNNAIVNAICATNSASTALNPFVLTTKSEVRALSIKIENPQTARKFIYGLRRINSSFFDTMVISNLSELTISNLNPTQYYVSACGVDSLDWYSMFSQEYITRVLSATDEILKKRPVELVQNKPNPFDELTLIPIIVNEVNYIKDAKLIFTSESGNVYKSIPLNLKEGINEILYDYQWNQYACGTYYYSLVINGNVFATKKMSLLNY
ncbi:MAG: M28 family peptidase [Saprospiraceae bacterium]|nr:M28 family peptidase [Saprospiraceae bacterium]MBK8296268.1 M28 family peptidase [Saprospiraceae bacterium]